MIENIANLKQPKTNKTEQNYERLSLVKMKQEEQFNNFFDLGIRAGNIRNKTHLYIFLQKIGNFVVVHYCCCCCLLLSNDISLHFSAKIAIFVLLLLLLLLLSAAVVKWYFHQNKISRQGCKFSSILIFLVAKKVSVNINLK